MNTEAEQDYDDPAIVTPGHQGLAGAALLIVGCLLFAGLVLAGANVLSGVGLVLAVWGVVLLVNGLVQARKHRDHGHEHETQEERTKRGVMVLALAFIVPPIGLLLGVSSPVVRGGRRLEGLAIAVGAVLTVLYTFGIVLFAAGARSPG